MKARKKIAQTRIECYHIVSNQGLLHHIVSFTKKEKLKIKRTFLLFCSFKIDKMTTTLSRLICTLIALSKRLKTDLENNKN